MARFCQENPRFNKVLRGIPDDEVEAHSRFSYIDVEALLVAVEHVDTRLLHVSVLLDDGLLARSRRTVVLAGTAVLEQRLLLLLALLLRFLALLLQPLLLFLVCFRVRLNKYGYTVHVQYNSCMQRNNSIFCRHYVMSCT